MNPVLLLLEQRVQCVPCRCHGFGRTPHPTLPEAKIFAEVRPVLFQNPIRLRFPALVVRGRFMKDAIQAAAQFRPAVRTGILSPDRIGRDNFLTAGVAALHRVRSLPKPPATRRGKETRSAAAASGCSLWREVPATLRVTPSGHPLRRRRPSPRRSHIPPQDRQ